MTSSPQVKRFDWGNLRLRILSGVILAPAVFAVVWIGEGPLLMMTAVATALLAIEWGKMSTPEAPGRTAALVSVAVLAPLFFAYRADTALAVLLLPLTGVTAALAARMTEWSRRSLDITFGVIYIGFPGLLFLWIRHGSGGLGWAATMLGATWTADIVAFIAGNVFKGPKLWPQISPNKTWSGFYFGLLGAVIAAMIVAYSGFLDGGPGRELAAPVGLAVGLATMAGDLWESILKRRFGVKDSGDLIPGHGGLLDRVDGLMFAIVVAAGLRLALSAHASPVFHATLSR